MKKILSIVLVLCLTLTSVSAFALNEDSVFEEYYSCDAEMDMSFRLEKYPSEMVEQLAGNDFIDFDEFLKGIAGTEYKIKIKSNSDESFKNTVAYAEADFSFPLVFNERLKINVDAGSKMWIDFDMSDLENLKYKFVGLTPANKKYVYADNLFELVDLDENAYEMLGQIIAIASDKDFRESINNIVKKNSKFDISSQKVIMTINGEGIKGIITDLLDVLLEKDILKGVDPVSLVGIKAMILAFPVGEDTLIKSEYSFKNGEISSVNSHCDLHIDISDVESYIKKLSGYDKTVEEAEDDEIIFGFDVNCKYNSVNKKVDIVFPELTEENSINLMDSMNPYANYEYVPDEFYSMEYYYIPSVGDGNPENAEKGKISLDELLFGLDIYLHNQDYMNSGTLNIKKGWWKEDVTITENSSKVLYGSEEKTLSEPITSFEDGLSISQIEEIFGIEYKGVSSYYYQMDEAVLLFKDPDYVEYVFEYPSFPNTIETWQSVSVFNEGATGLTKDKISLKFTNVMEGFAIEENAVVNANGSINFNFYNRYITFTPGSNIIVVNGESITIDKPVLEIQGDFIVSCDFIEKAFNCSLDNIYFDRESEEISCYLEFVNDGFVDNDYVHFDW